jgi:hypothetical protein
MTAKYRRSRPRGVDEVRKTHLAMAGLYVAVIASMVIFILSLGGGV